MIARLSKSFRFEAAHFLPTFPEGHKCRRMHGHSFIFDVILEGQVPEETGYLIDYGQIAELCEPIRKQLDHYLLNDIDGLENPTAEVLARWIWRKLQTPFDQLTQEIGRPTDLRLAEIIVHETCTSACHYRGQ